MTVHEVELDEFCEFLCLADHRAQCVRVTSENSRDNAGSHAVILSGKSESCQKLIKIVIPDSIRNPGNLNIKKADILDTSPTLGRLFVGTAGRLANDFK